MNIIYSGLRSVALAVIVCCNALGAIRFGPWSHPELIVIVFAALTTGAVFLVRPTPRSASLALATQLIASLIVGSLWMLPEFRQPYVVVSLILAAIESLLPFALLCLLVFSSGAFRTPRARSI